MSRNMSSESYEKRKEAKNRYRNIYGHRQVQYKVKLFTSFIYHHGDVTMTLR